MAVIWKNSTKSIEVVDKILCNRCEKEIPKVFSDIEQEGPQGEDMLTIRLLGGYGEFFDPIGTVCHDLHLCKECAQQLVRANPWLKPGMGR